MWQNRKSKVRIKSVGKNICFIKNKATRIMHAPSSSSHHHHFTVSLSPPPPPNLTSPSSSSVSSSNPPSPIRSVKPPSSTSKMAFAFDGILSTANSIFKKFHFRYKTYYLLLDLKYCLDNFTTPLLEIFLKIRG